ncbi:hypothetical protein [Rhizomonospora bruguierae]|uniref:hypothetical protein n=1 Tax=Rhizomonospora bruguierae TaxID=1581705 RepID=UPI0020C1106E|nr:hypothetical protein [Micromonospora sp. NBRC 107566]
MATSTVEAGHGDRPGGEGHGDNPGPAGPGGQPSGATLQPAPPASEHARAAASSTSRSTEFTLPLLGTVKLPPADDLAFLGGIGVLALVGAVEWPIAVVLGAGHALATTRRDRVLHGASQAH